MNKKYGFYTEEYEDDTSIETLMTGDGKTEFTDILHGDGVVSLGLSYGDGVGVGVIRDHPEGTLAVEAGVKWQIKFESQESVDSMITTLLRVKNQLALTKS